MVVFKFLVTKASTSAVQNIIFTRLPVASGNVNTSVIGVMEVDGD